jgi:hypothetical protein
LAETANRGEAVLEADVQVISVDDHVIEHPRVFQDRLPAKWRERGPKIIEISGQSTDPLGNVHHGAQQLWDYDGNRYPYIGLNAVAGRPKQEFGIEPVRYDDMRPGCYDSAARIADMDEDGIHAQLCFPSFPGFAGSTFFAAQDKELACECVKAWNDFAIDEWAGSMPGRQIPMAILPYWDVELSAKEVERTAAKGAKAVSFTEAPHSVGLPSYHSGAWDPMLAALQDAQMPLCLHFGSGGAPAIAPLANFAMSIALLGIFL